MEQDKNFDTIYQLYYAKVYRLCKGYFNGDNDIASDVTQEVFIKVWENLSKFRNESNVSTWIYKIASNTCLMYLRKTSNRKVVHTNEIPEMITGADLQDSEEKFFKMYSCINQLEPGSRLIIMMVLEDLGYDRIAEVMGITEENLRVRIHRIKSKLTKCVQNGRV